MEGGGTQPIDQGFLIMFFSAGRVRFRSDQRGPVVPLYRDRTRASRVKGGCSTAGPHTQSSQFQEMQWRSQEFFHMGGDCGRSNFMRG